MSRASHSHGGWAATSPAFTDPTSWTRTSAARRGGSESGSSLQPRRQPGWGDQPAGVPRSMSAHATCRRRSRRTPNPLREGSLFGVAHMPPLAAKPPSLQATVSPIPRTGASSAWLEFGMTSLSSEAGWVVTEAQFTGRINDKPPAVTGAIGIRATHTVALARAATARRGDTARADLACQRTKHAPLKSWRRVAAATNSLRPPQAQE